MRETGKKPRARRWSWARAGRWAAQALALLLFLWLFRRTEGGADGQARLSVDLAFRIDPLVGAAAMLGERGWIGSLWPGLVTLGLSALIGRFFCGWVCPLGTLIDVSRLALSPLRRLFARVVGRLRRPRLAVLDARPRSRGWEQLRWGLLVVILVAALLGAPLVGFFDPFALLVRALAFSVDPAVDGGVTRASAWLLAHGSPSVTSVSEPIYGFLRAHLLPFHSGPQRLATLSLVLLAAILAVEVVGRRLWCRYLCPLGALLGLVARFSPVGRIPAKACKDCTACADACRMGALDDGKRAPEECVLCLDCAADCPRGAARFVVGRDVEPQPVEPARRTLLAALVAGAALPAVGRALPRPRGEPPIRPPGALAEDEFLDRCVRCGSCHKVCPTGGLQSTVLEAGWDGVFTPRLVARIGYCEWTCTLCGQVCPTGAIERLPLPDKQRRVIAKAEVDRARCLPWATGEPCIVCEEHCPLPRKAIRLEEVEVRGGDGNPVILQRPWVARGLCIGCGICETKCPIDGAAGIVIRRHHR